jgi:hypothetical protein
LSCPLTYRIDAFLHLGRNRISQVFSPSSPAHSPDTFQNITKQLGVQGEDLRVFTKSHSQLSHLPSGQGSKVADGLGQQNIWVRRLQCRFIGDIQALALPEPLGNGPDDLSAGGIAAIENAAHYDRLGLGLGWVITVGRDSA